MPMLDGPSSPQQAKLSAFSAPPGAHLNYYGGRVVSNMQVVQVLWGNGGVGSGNGQFLAGVKNTTSPSMATFYQAVLNSSYVDWLTEYNTDIIDFGGGSGTNQIIGRGSFAAQYVITPSDTSNPIDDSAIQTELANQITGGHLPAPTTDAAGNNNTYYAIFFPHGMSITLGTSGSCVSGGFCAYHGTIANVGGNEIYYGVHPDMQAGSGCFTGCGSNPTVFENQTSVASHEMIETITDPEVALAPSFAPPLAWYDPINGEIGDICNGQDSHVVGSDGLTYAVQTEFSNTENNCVVVGTVPTTVLTIAPSKFNFGKVTATASSKAHTFTVTNKGTVTADIGTISAAMVSTSTSPFQVSPGTCSGTLIPKQRCKLSVTFAPTVADGLEDGTLTVAYNGGTVSADLTGTSMSAAPSAPKSVGLKGAAPSATGPAKTIKIINHSKALIMLGAAPTLGPDFTPSNNTCSNTTLAQGMSCTLQIATTPGGGTMSGQILNEQLTYSFSYGPNSGNVMITLKSKVL